MEKDATATMKAKLEKQMKNKRDSDKKVSLKLLEFRGYTPKKKEIIKASKDLTLIERMNKVADEMRALNIKMKKRL